MTTSEIESGETYQIAIQGEETTVRALWPSIAARGAWVCTHPDGTRLQVELSQFLQFVDERVKVR